MDSADEKAENTLPEVLSFPEMGDADRGPIGEELYLEWVDRCGGGENDDDTASFVGQPERPSQIENSASSIVDSAGRVLRR